MMNLLKVRKSTRNDTLAGHFGVDDVRSRMFYFFVEVIKHGSVAV